MRDVTGELSDPRHYLYREIDPEAARTLAMRALARAEDGELFLQYNMHETFSFDDGRLKTAAYGSDCGFGLRGVTGEATAFAHGDGITAAAIARAADTLAVLDPARAPAPGLVHGVNHRLYTDQNPLDHPGFAEKVKLLERINQVARARDPRVVQVTVSLSGSWNVVEIIRPDGTRAHDVRPLVRLSLSVLMEANGRKESGSWGMGGRYLYARLFEEGRWQAGLDLAIAQAEANLEARPAPAGEATVVVGPGWPGVLLHEAVGHGLEGDFNRKGLSAFSGRIGERVGAPGVTVVDDGSLAECRGSLTIDDEGTPTSETVLIEDGILKAYMHDRLNARLMGVAPTGNGRRESYAHAPMPRMTNTFMKSGTEDPESLIARVQDGLYARNFGGGQVDIVSGKFVFACTEAWKIEKGRLAYPVKGAMLIGDGPTVLTRIRGIGNDSSLDLGVGMCGKGGQSIPAGVGQPTLLIEGLTVGGTDV